MKSSSIAPLGLLALCASARAATLTVSPRGAQPGDILTITVSPTRGEKIEGVGMSAFDTSPLKFYSRPDGSARAFVGYPFDRKGGSFPLAARVQTGMGEQIVRAVFQGRTRDYPTQHITMRDSKTASKMNQKDALHREKLLVQSKMQSSYAAPLWSGNWIVPCAGAATSAYGRRRYVNGKWWGQHNGADVKAASGTPVHAANSGRVVLSEYLPALRGNCVVVDHGCNVFSVYMHLSKREVSEGQAVQKGEELGKVGATGFVTGPHLHWEVRVGQEPVDPNHVVARGISF
jgi:murein DD-endopeptidase MepM/ murein hydrolase activator NlpD